MSTPDTKANLKIGDVLGGTEPGLRAQACLLYKEWDEEDGELYYWEEWELVGPNRYEYLVEVDHRRLSRRDLRPLRAPARHGRH